MSNITTESLWPDERNRNAAMEAANFIASIAEFRNHMEFAHAIREFFHLEQTDATKRLKAIRDAEQEAKWASNKTSNC